MWYGIMNNTPTHTLVCDVATSQRV